MNYSIFHIVLFSLVLLVRHNHLQKWPILLWIFTKWQTQHKRVCWGYLCYHSNSMLMKHFEYSVMNCDQLEHIPTCMCINNLGDHVLYKLLIFGFVTIYETKGYHFFIWFFLFLAPYIGSHITSLAHLIFHKINFFLSSFFRHE